ncbi:MAG: 16S rRNA (guanine(527)-N(7))-methyltransferase RsmG [candidate division WOR-3 bacterium]|nr:16S rRNA (guanine(527)-N(7))-methyltransferase RsmG [candidate division WOR-3 bacterium]
MLSTQWSVLSEWCKKLDINLVKEQLTKFQTYHQLLLDWNRRINLISRKDINRIISYHFIDSISAINEISEHSIVADLGTGAGLPGIPIKILRPDLKLYLVESIKKKALFLNEVLRTLQLNDAWVLNQRAETIKNLKFDFILARLLGKISEILPIAANLLFNQGKIIFYKVESSESEILQATHIAEKHKFILDKIKDTVLPTTKIKRRLVIYRKLKNSKNMME